MFGSEQKVKHDFIIIIQEGCHFLCPDIWLTTTTRLPSWLCGEESACNTGAAGDRVSTPGSERSLEEGSGDPFPYSCLYNPMDSHRLSMRSKRVEHNWGDLANTLPQGRAYLTYIQSMSREVPGWMTHKMESRLWEKYQQLQICRWTIMAENEEELESLLMKVKKESEKLA